jgi:transposase-like protein
VAAQASPTAQQNEQAGHRGRYRNYTIAFKIHVVQYALRSSIRATARHFGLDRRVVRSWVRNQGTYQEQDHLHTRYRVTRADLSQYPTMENELFAWIMDQRSLSLCVTTGMIRTQALGILNDINFSASCWQE